MKNLLFSHSKSINVLSKGVASTFNATWLRWIAILSLACVIVISLVQFIQGGSVSEALNLDDPRWATILTVATIVGVISNSDVSYLHSAWVTVVAQPVNLILTLLSTITPIADWLQIVIIFLWVIGVMLWHISRPSPSSLTKIQ